MDPLSITLGDLLAPFTPDRFFSETWELEPLAICRDNAACYRDLFATRDLDALIAFGRPSVADSSAFESVAQRPATYVRGVLGDQPASSPEQPDIAELRQVYEQGKSLVIMGMQRRWPAIAQLCRNLEVVFHCPVHANLYLTPAGSQGFAAHFDTHEVFVLQLEGEKHWRLFGAAEDLPLATDSVPLSRKPGKPTQEITLRAGDLLYIPRGHVHEASTGNTRSLHLTVGVNVYRWADLLRHALACVSRQDVNFRKSIPGGALPGEGPELKQQFQALVAHLADWAAADGLFERAQASLADQFFSQLKMLPCGQFADRDGLEKLHLDSVVERNVQAVCRVVQGEQGVAIEFPGNRVGGPHRVASALRFVAGAKRFAVRELPDDLTSEGKLVLVRRLVREGREEFRGSLCLSFTFPGRRFRRTIMETTVQQGNWQKQWGMLVAQAWSDDDLKQRLVAEPAAVLEEYGIEVPPGVELRVLEDTDEVCHLVLPANPSGDLVDEELTSSIGFDSFSGICGGCGCGRCGCGCRRCGCFES